jgi:hypothetical protein
MLDFLFIELALIVVYLYCTYWMRKLRRLDREERRRWE